MITSSFTSRMPKLVLTAAILLYAGILSVAVQANSLGIPESEYNALKAIYNNTGGPKWSHQGGWNTEASSWDGVIVSDGHVMILDLRGWNLTGKIPPEIADLPHLEKLLLTLNKITEPIPSEIGRLSALTDLYLDSNQITGFIPPEIGNLSNLEHLSLAKNALTGSIPPELGNLKNLWYLGLQNNRLTGEIPRELGQMSNLSWLDLYMNLLTGNIPAELADLSLLTTMQIGSNELTGPIPPEFERLAYLKILNVGKCHLSGSLTGKLGNLPNLEQLTLPENEFTGSIPVGLTNSKSLKAITLNNNMFNGALPSEFANMAQLQSLSLGANQLSGTIPPELGSMTALTQLSLNYNHLTGPIPPEFGNLTNLTSLTLNKNQLSGQIPSALGNLTKLQVLMLSSNKLTGEVPRSLLNLTSLLKWNLDVGYNMLVASDPEVAAFCTNLRPQNLLTQTLPPTNVSVSVESNGDMRVSWTPTTYQANPGYYEIGLSTQPGGPYDFSPLNRTANKSASSIVARNTLGMNTVYVIVRTVTLNNLWNESILISEPTSEIGVSISIVDKRGADGSKITSEPMIVYAVTESWGYAESPNRAWGIKLVGANIPLGMVRITGTLGTEVSGERFVQVESITDVSQRGQVSEIKPVYLTNKVLGGGDWRYDPTTGVGQKGINGSLGPNNIGMYVKITGKVTMAGRGWFYVDDGSKVSDGSGVTGIYVECPGWDTPAKGAVVEVTGISSCDRYLGATVNKLIPVVVFRVLQPVPTAPSSMSAGTSISRNPRTGTE